MGAGRRLEILDLYVIKLVKASRCLSECRLRKLWCAYDLVYLFCCRNERLCKSCSLMIRIFCDIKPYHSAIFMTFRKNNTVLSKRSLSDTASYQGRCKSTEALLWEPLTSQKFSVSWPLWSSGQSFWLQIQRSRVRSPALPDFLSSSGSGTGSTQPREPRKVNWGATWMKKSCGSRSRKQRLTAVGTRCTDHVTPSIRKSWH